MVPLVFAVFVAHLALRVVASVQGVRAANEALEARVAAAGADIAAAYERERELLAAASAAGERERIYHDLHDSLGARLLTLVHSAPDARQAELARDALAEMRTIIAASQVNGGRLAELAAEWQVEAELRAEDARCAIVWQVDGDAELGARQRYQLEQIVRELVSNALEHAQASGITVRWSAGARALTLEVGDDGRGLASGAAGQGLAGIRARAADLGGQAGWETPAGGGTCCRVFVPLAPAHGEA
jgi:signal transduction histidine kinase